MTFKRFTALALCLALLVAVFGGCASPSEKYAGEMQEKITMGYYHVETDESENVSMTAEVTLPDYSAYMAQCLEQAALEAKDEKDFEEKLYKLVLEATKEAPADATREVAVDLTALDPEKVQRDWTLKELTEAVRQAAFDAEVEEFCLDLLRDSFPTEYFTESEAGAE